MRNNSGQTMLMTVLIVVVLAISVTVVVYLNQMQNQFSIFNQRRQKASSICQLGLSYAMHKLSESPAIWQSALGGAYPAEFSDPGPIPHQYDANLNDGTVYTIQCSTGAAKYQIQVLVTALAPSHGQLLPKRALSALVSQNTLAVNLPDAVGASLALQLSTAPLTSPFNIHWGPIALFDANANTWNLNDPMDTGHYPRKFSTGAIGGTNPTYPRSLSNPPVNSDSLEYWSNISLGYPHAVDLATYKTLAQATVPAVTPTCALINPCPTVCPNPAFPVCADFEIGNDTATFSGTTINQPGAVYYVNGSVRFDNTAIDLKGDATPSTFPAVGAFIITRTATIGNVTAASGEPLTNLRIPTTADLEYPANSLWAQTIRPCNGLTGSCPSATANTPESANMHYRGFLYVQGNLTETNPANVPFHMAGVARVDGMLTTLLSAGNQPLFRLYYDDEISHSILTTPFELQIDSQQNVAPH